MPHLDVHTSYIRHIIIIHRVIKRNVKVSFGDAFVVRTHRRLCFVIACDNNMTHHVLLLLQSSAPTFNNTEPNTWYKWYNIVTTCVRRRGQRREEAGYNIFSRPCGGGGVVYYTIYEPQIELNIYFFSRKWRKTLYLSDTRWLCGERRKKLRRGFAIAHLYPTGIHGI